jgi:hypothetical protein
MHKHNLHRKMHIFSSYRFIDRSIVLRDLCKNKLTLFRYQGLNLVNTLFLGSVLAIKLLCWNILKKTLRIWCFEVNKSWCICSYFLALLQPMKLSVVLYTVQLEWKLSCKNRVFLGENNYIQIFSTHAFFTWANAHTFITKLSIDSFDNLCKNNLTLFHHQGLTLENTLFPDSALGTQLPDFHHHLF